MIEEPPNLLDINQKGEYIFVYSDRYNIFLIFLDRLENKLYKITADKYLAIEYIEEIETPINFSEFKQIKFFKPFIKNDEYNFVGVIVFENTAFRFCIDERNILDFNEEIEYNVNNGIVNTLSCLKTVDVESYIQKKEKVYVVGYDEKYQDYIFAIVNINDDKFEKVYSLYTDYGDIVPLSINIDTEEKKIYVVGKIISEDGEVVNPYFETFLLQ